MSRDETKMMQGVAIIMMIFYHLFTFDKKVDTLPATLVGFGAANNPVPLYTLLSGYGFYMVWKRGQKDRHLVSRCLKLYSVYWITLTVFLLIGISGGGNFS